jgi:hypothetical protein
MRKRNASCITALGQLTVAFSASLWLHSFATSLSKRPAKMRVRSGQQSYTVERRMSGWMWRSAKRGQGRAGDVRETFMASVIAAVEAIDVSLRPRP